MQDFCVNTPKSVADAEKIGYTLFDVCPFVGVDLYYRSETDKTTAVAGRTE